MDRFDRILETLELGENKMVEHKYKGTDEIQPSSLMLMPQPLGITNNKTQRDKDFDVDIVDCSFVRTCGTRNNSGYKVNLYLLVFKGNLHAKDKDFDDDIVDCNFFKTCGTRNHSSYKVNLYLLVFKGNLHVKDFLN